MDPKSGEVVDFLGHAEVAARTLLLGDISGATAEIGSGKVAIVLLDATFEDLKDVPKALEHRVRTSFDIPPGSGATSSPNRPPTSAAKPGS